MSQTAPHPGVRRVVDLPTGPVVVLDVSASPEVPPRGDALLVPGYTGSKEDFAPILTGLAGAGFRVVAMDLPGQYESPGPAKHSEYSVDGLGQVVLAVAERVARGPVHLLGHSFGGLVARAAAIAAPDRLRSLVLLCSGAAALNGPRAERMRRLAPVLDAGGMPAVYAAMDELERQDPRYHDVPSDVRAFFRHRFLASSAHGLRGMGEALQNEPDRVSELRSTGVPVLVLYGDADDAWSPDVQADMAARLGARRTVIDGAGHSPAVEQPAPTVAALVEFWCSVEAADAVDAG